MDNFNERKLKDAICQAFVVTDPDLEPHSNSNVADGLFAIAEALHGMSRAIQNLGTGDAYTGGKGAIEFLGMQQEESLSNVTASLDGISAAIDRHGEAVESASEKAS